jgi:hypothetical protein
MHSLFWIRYRQRHGTGWSHVTWANDDVRIDVRTQQPLNTNRTVYNVQSGVGATVWWTEPCFSNFDARSWIDCYSRRVGLEVSQGSSGRSLEPSKTGQAAVPASSMLQQCLVHSGR